MKFENAQSRNFFLAILGVATFFRVMGIFRPLLGNFSSLQVIYAMMARNFLGGDWNLFLPRMDVLLDGSLAIRLLDLPLTSFGVALVCKLTTFPVDSVGRLWSSFFSLAALFPLFGIVKRLAGEKCSLFTVFFFAFSPLSIIYGQSFQTDTTALFLILTALSILDGTPFRRFAISALLVAIALLLRIQFIFLMPVFLFKIIRSGSRDFRSLSRCAVWSICALTPLFFWNLFIYLYLNAHPDHVIMSIFHQLQTKTFGSYKPWGLFFLKNFSMVFLRFVLNPLGGFLALWGFIMFASQKEFRVMTLWFLLMALMSVVMTKKVIDMNYYLLGFTVPAAFFLAAVLSRNLRNRWMAPAFMTGYVMLSFVCAWNAAYRTPSSDKPVLSAAAFVQTHTRSEDLILASHGTNSALLYYCQRKGWNFPIVGRVDGASPYAVFTLNGKPMSPALKERIDELKGPVSALEYYRKQGASYFVCSRLPEFDAASELKLYLDSHYTLFVRTDDFVVYALS